MDDGDMTKTQARRTRQERSSRRSLSFRLREPKPGIRIMPILCDTQIRELIGIEPFKENIKRPGQVSFGVSSYGYDIRVGSVFKIFHNINSTIIDPKQFSDRSFVTIDTDQ